MIIALISPSKTLDLTSSYPQSHYTLPELINFSQKLADHCKQLSQDDLSTLMKISEKLALLNFERFQQWQTPFTLNNARPSIYTFKGDVYEGLNSETLNHEEIQFAQSHLRILSGFYGVIRPLDLIQPYRLEMGIPLKNNHYVNLYQFWGDVITEHLNQQFDGTHHNHYLINLASNEYFKSINKKKINANIIEPIFLDKSNSGYKVISFYAKKARGMMARFIIKNKISAVEDLKHFDYGHYQFQAKQSNESQWVFSRDLK